MSRYFYPRSPCGERPAWNRFAQRRDFISIHALLAESDGKGQSSGARITISIHALLAESDSQQPDGTTNTTYFYPRSPCGERRPEFCDIVQRTYFYPRSPCGERREPTALRTPHQRFLSTLSLRRATGRNRHNVNREHISIHALLAESDAWNRFVQRRDFISIHALLAESD